MVTICETNLFTGDVSGSNNRGTRPLRPTTKAPRIALVHVVQECEGTTISEASSMFDYYFALIVTLTFGWMLIKSEMHFNSGKSPPSFSRHKQLMRNNDAEKNLQQINLVGKKGFEKKMLWYATQHSNL